MTCNYRWHKFRYQEVEGYRSINRLSNTLCDFPQNGASKKESPISRTLFSMSFVVPSKGRLPPGSPQIVPTERDAPFPDLLFILLSKSPLNDLPFQFPQWGPYGKRCQYPEPSSTQPVKELSSRFHSQSSRRERCSVSKSLKKKSPVNEPLFSLSSGGPTERDACPLSPPLLIFPDPQQRIRPPGSRKSAPAERYAPFPEPSFNYL